MSGISNALLGKRGNQICMVLCALGALTFAVGLAVTPERAWANLLLHNFYFLSLSMMGAVFIAVSYLSKAGWSTVFRRVPEAMLTYQPLGAALTLCLLLGVPSLYLWADPDAVSHDAILQAKSGFLNIQAFGIRMVLILALWAVLSIPLVKNSRRQDETGELSLTTRNVRISAFFIILFALSYCLASVDWLMSLEPLWYSTMFPWYIMSSVFVSGLCLITIFSITLRKRGYLPGFNRHHQHDLGKYVFAFSVFWGYLWFSQYMLIWYTNIPEEVTFFQNRTGPWLGLFTLNVLLNLVLPFILLPAGNKKNDRLLLTVCVILVLSHWLDLYQVIMPVFMPDGPQLGILELGTGLGILSAFLLATNLGLRRAPLLPAKDPYFQESLHHRL